MNRDDETDPRATTSVLAIVAGVTGLVAFVFAPAGLAAVVLGHIALFRINRANGVLRGKGLSVFALIMGYLAIALIVYNRSQ